MLSANGVGKKAAAISPKFANAAPFMPKSVAPRSNASTPSISQSSIAQANEWAVPDAPDFVPQNYEASQPTNSAHLLTPNHSYDSFIHTPNPLGQANEVVQHANPYHDPGFFPAQATFQQPPQYHLYAPLGPYNQSKAPYQRTVHDLFIPNDLREEFQKKSAASWQTLPSSNLPAHIEGFHSLLPLDAGRQRNVMIFGYPSWIYKAQSSKDGNFYALRRLEGFRLTNEKSIRSVSNWKKVVNSSIVNVHDAFTNRSFGDSSLFFVTDYFPLSKTLAEHHFSPAYSNRNRHTNVQVPEQTLWSYVSQISSALKAIHSNGLAARVIDASKVLLTDKNRVRLNACAIMDVVQFEPHLSLPDLQRQDLTKFGMMMLSIGTHIPDVTSNPAKAMDQFTRMYGAHLRDAVMYLASAGTTHETRNIDDFISRVAPYLLSAFDSALHQNDQLTSEFAREVENARLFRLMAKFNFITDRPEMEHGSLWSETGPRYFLRLFRDYLFHRVDSHNNPVVDLGHVLTCLNKLDAGSEEKVTLVSRDEQSAYIVSYKETKKALESAFQDLTKRGGRIA
ncbi:MAG: hypothetical protein Q9227_000616 [Pyrenula ochraceoflavens]